MCKCAGGFSNESAWVFGQLTEFLVSQGPHRKPKLQYQLPLVGDVCRKCWILSAGYLNGNNNRVRAIEARLRRGEKGLGVKLPKRRLVNPSSYARAFMSEYIFQHSQSSPSDTILYVDYCGNKECYRRYIKELKGHKALKFASFVKSWNAVLCSGVTDPETTVQYVVQIRKSKAKGFAKCNLCQLLKMLMSGTSNVAKRATHQRKMTVHIADVTDDREALARIIRKCIKYKNHCGFYLDAADSQKFPVPTTTSTAKLLSQLWRVRQKLTCVQTFSNSKKLYIFRTLPNVPTGGNLTATILTRLLNTGDFRHYTDLYINVDGAGDNICYTLYYYLVHILLCAEKSGWPLKRIHLLRMKVGHTHNDLDATFALLSKYVYGKHARGDSRKNILSFASFKEVSHTHTHIVYTRTHCVHAHHLTPNTHTTNTHHTHRCVSLYMGIASSYSRTYEVCTILTTSCPHTDQKERTKESKNIFPWTWKSGLSMVRPACSRAQNQP